jgi:hypothetical protein
VKFSTLAKLTQARYGTKRSPAIIDLCQKVIVVAAIAAHTYHSELPHEMPSKGGSTDELQPLNRRTRVCSASSMGVTPKSRLNSRLNCDGLS